MNKNGNDLSEIARKIEKLLALSKSPNEAEASAAVEKAHKLLLEYNLSMSDIGSMAGGQSKVEEVPIGDRHAYSYSKKWRNYLMTCVAKTNFCVMMQWTYTDVRTVRYYILGRKHNAQAAISMIEYLCKAIVRISRDECDATKLKYRDTFRFGMVLNICNRLQTLYQQEMTDSDCQALVLVEDKEVRDYMTANHSDAGRLDIDITDENKMALHRGYQAGDKVNLSRQIQGAEQRNPAGALEYSERRA